MKEQLIAPCGFDCALCSAYQNQGSPCRGCRSKEKKQKHCDSCAIRNCKNVSERSSGFCVDCGKFPCARLKRLDKKYRDQYKVSLIDNLNDIQKKGMEAFLLAEEKRWTCKACGETVCIHKRSCLHCGRSVKRLV